jgi:hypothetical protein
MRNYFIYSIELFLIFKFANSLSNATDPIFTTENLTSTLTTISNSINTVPGNFQNSTNITISVSSISATTTSTNTSTTTTTSTNTSTTTTTSTSTLTTTPSKCRFINCQNNGTCLLDNSNDPYCSCQNSFSGKYCEICSFKL